MGKQPIPPKPAGALAPVTEAIGTLSDSIAEWLGQDPAEIRRTADAAARRERVTRRLLALACFFGWYAVLFLGAIGLTMSGSSATFFNMLLGIPACVLASLLTWYTVQRWK